MNARFVEALLEEQRALGHLPQEKDAKVVVALSGGVDSSVVAALLKSAGCPVEALFMKNWEEDDSAGCSAQTDLEDARAVCRQLDIPLHCVNFSAEYWEGVFEHFLEELKLGRTPNPDVLCNTAVKFDPCLRYARKLLGATYLATGHYARIYRKDGELALLKGLDRQKDQTYFLHRLSLNQLVHAYFPLGGLEKSVVRELARFFQLPTAQKKDSTGICFIGPKRFSQFIARYLPLSPGPICDEWGRHLGEHSGLAYYTIGQRKGLRLSQSAEKPGQAWYVLKKEMAQNRLIVTSDAKSRTLFTQRFYAQAAHWIGQAPQSLLTREGLRCAVKVRYRQIEVACRVFSEGDTLRIESKETIRACTPGQYAVFYQDERLLGGAIIQ